jgi:hypothetical protein
MKKVVLVFSLLLIFSISGCRKTNRAIQEWSGDLSQDAKVYGDADKRISDYHWYEEMHQQIKSQKASLLMRTNAGQDVTDEMIIVNNWIGEYNARSRQFDRAYWKSGTLPYQLELITSVEDLKK